MLPPLRVSAGEGWGEGNNTCNFNHFHVICANEQSPGYKKSINFRRYFWLRELSKARCFTRKSGGFGGASGQDIAKLFEAAIVGPTWDSVQGESRAERTKTRRATRSRTRNPALD